MIKLIGFGVITAVAINSIIFWDIMWLTFNGLRGVIFQKIGLFTIHLD
jgi:hypothetical protein